MPNDAPQGYKGPETLVEFLEVFGATFQTDDEARLGFSLYIKAKHSGLPMAIGRLSDIHLLDPREFEVLRLPDGQWTPAINEVWLQGGVDRGDDSLELGFLGFSEVQWDIAALEDGLRATHRVVELHPQFPWPRVRRAGLLAQLDRLAEARADLDEAIRCELGSRVATIAHFLRGRILCVLGANTEALVDADRLVELAPDEAGPLIRRAALHMVLGNHAAARADLDRAIAMDSGNPAAFFGRAKVLVSLGLLEPAVADIESAIALEPASASLRVEQAKLLYQLGREQQAEESLTQAVALQPNHDEAPYVLAQMLASRGEFAAARDALALLRESGHLLHRSEVERDPAFQTAREQSDFKSFVETLEP
jgi:tetratricopeptide (TPR) repeat protein